jgi:hypothetical protein
VRWTAWRPCAEAQRRGQSHELDAIAPPLELAALVYFCVAVFTYRMIVAAKARGGKGLLGAIQPSA